MHRPPPDITVDVLHAANFLTSLCIFLLYITLDLGNIYKTQYHNIFQTDHSITISLRASDKSTNKAKNLKLTLNAKRMSYKPKSLF